MHFQIIIFLALFQPQFPVHFATKVPLPEKTHPFESKYCRNTNETYAIRGPCLPSINPAGSLSPCPYGCIATHLTKLGDPCDPFLLRFALRQYHDYEQSKKNWMKYIIGKPIKPDNADWEYKGDCSFFCPRVLCMDVYYDPASPNDITQFVDLFKYDCIREEIRDQYKGTCTCGSTWSLVDPASPHMKFNRTSELVNYKKVKGLDRRLIWDHRKERCAADRYGHCSLDWDVKYPNEVRTFCENPNHKCVNRSTTYLGRIFRPVQVIETQQWYGLCDTENPITDPFAGSAHVRMNSFYVFFCVCILACWILT